MSFSTLTSRLASAARFGAGARINPELGPRPAQRLIVYEFEGCPFCRRVREAISDLDLAVEIRPCPKGGQRFRPSVKERSGAGTFPFLIDPNHNAEMFESADIVRHLYTHYGNGVVPPHIASPMFLLTSQLASVLRGTAGALRRASRAPREPLQLDGFEGDPEARLVREKLCELELPYVRRNSDVVRLADPTTDRSLEGYESILGYLQETWAA